MYRQGNYEEARVLIDRLRHEADLRTALIEGGIETARKRDWSSLEDEIAALYC